MTTTSPLLADEDESGGSESQPQPDSNLSDSETSFTGAVMLVGNDDVTMQSVLPGELYNQNDTRYAFFVGNTLYAGVADEHGNTVDLIGEFFWFESSIDRGSDFYVGVFKVRTSPLELDDWRLETGDSILYLDAQSNLDAQTGSFRWDWSVPFESYGWDSFGSVSLETEYGLGLNAEGSAMTATEADEDGQSYSASVQAKGYLNSEYKVRTQYQVTLWRWEVMVQGSAGRMSWDMVLNSPDREDQYAYHEFFLVMQTENGQPFEVSSLEFGGQVKDSRMLWFDDHSNLSALIPSIILSRPELPAEEPEDEEPEGDDDNPPEAPDENEGGSWPIDDEEEEEAEPNNNSSIWKETTGGGCSAASTTGDGLSSKSVAVLAIFALLGALRRRDPTALRIS
jgi:MYXO-CTERM domain-containing protein